MGEDHDLDPVILLLAPGLLGVFWGAPLVTRELEARTFPLAWNQSVTRTQWMAVKLGLVGLLAMAAAGLLSLMLTWWSSPIDTSISLSGSTRIDLTRLGPTLFDTRDITPVGYAAFAFALGVTAGLLIRRTVPAMAATLAGGDRNLCHPQRFPFCRAGVEPRSQGLSAACAGKGHATRPG